MLKIAFSVTQNRRKVFVSVSDHNIVKGNSNIYFVIVIQSHVVLSATKTGKESNSTLCFIQLHLHA